MKLSEYIKTKYGTQLAFAETNGYAPSQVSVMVKNGDYYVIDGRLMIDKRPIK